MDVVNALIRSAPEAPKPKAPGRRPSEILDVRLTECHFAGHIQPKPGAKKLKPMRDCIVCNVPKSELAGCKRKQTAFECKQCEKAMCMPVCFERYHTLRDFKLNQEENTE